MIDRKGVFSFLIITFGITYLVEGLLILSGFRVNAVPAIGGQLTVAAVMWVPSLATLLTLRLVTHEKVSTTWLRFGPSWKPYLASALLIPLCFLVTYLLTWLLGLGQPDWPLTSFYATIATTGVDMSTAPDPTLLLVGLFFLSFITAPFVNSIFGLGEEWGWRGFLLPRLLPLGKTKAYLLLGVIWGLWHAPLVLIGFNYPNYPLLGVLFMVLLTTAIGWFINEMAARYQSSILAGWIHGVFNSQAYGIWRALLFPSTNPYLGGITGIVGLLVLALAGYLTMRRFQQSQALRPLTAQAAH